MTGATRLTRVVAQQWVSLDGYASGTDGEDALFAHVHAEADERSQRYNVELCPTVHHVLLGRRTYESFVSYWPTATETIAETVNAVPKVVASRSLTHAPWPDREPATVAADVLEHVRQARHDGAGDILIWGSLELVRRLVAAGELDELDLFVLPVVLGTGVPLLTEPLALTQTASEDWGTLTHVRYDIHSAGDQPVRVDS